MKSYKFACGILLFFTITSHVIWANGSISSRTKMLSRIDSIKQLNTITTNNQSFEPTVTTNITAPIIDDANLFDYTVGEIPIQSGVSPIGGRTYTIPINVFPGIGDMTPEIAISYNSFQNNGIAGIGWGISGLSSIVRTNKSIYYDGKTSGISQNADDAFMLDGQRLIRIADKNGVPCYQTAQGNIKVEATLSGNDVCQFTVLYPDGKIGLYTASDDGKMVYPLTRYGNIDGIIIDYTYSCVQNNHLIQSISYNTNAKIAFTYEERPDSLLTYTNGYSTGINKRLSKISTSFRNKTLGEYTLSYDTINTASHLTRISYTAQGQSFSPLIFEYGEGTPLNSYSTKTIWLNYAYAPTEPKNNKHTRITKGKFDYTHSDGIISLPNRESYSLIAMLDPFTGLPTVITLTNKYDGQTNDYIYITPDLENDNSYVTTLPIGQGYIDALCMDLTGTQQDYIVRINNNIVNDRDQVTFTVYRYSNTSLSCEALYTRTYDFGGLYMDLSENKSLHPKHFYAGDFNGDGIQDVMAITSSMPYENVNIECRIYDIAHDNLLYSGSPFSCNFILSSYWGGYSADQIKNMDHLFVMDYNNDGKSDICIIKEDGTYMHEFDNNNSNTMSCSQINSYTDLTRSSLIGKQLLIGEFNGDGLADLLLTPTKDNKATDWKMFCSTGNGTFAASIFTGPTADDGECDDFIIQDVNCDGKSDLIKCYENKFTTFINENNIPNIEVCTCTMDSKSAIAPTSITSHNYFSHVLTLNNNKLVKHSFLNDVNKQKLLTTMTNSYCNKECTTYKYPFDENPSYRTENIKSAYFPYVILNERIPFIASSHEVFNGNNINNCTYEFRNLTMHRQGLGMCGMERTTVKGEQLITAKRYAPTQHGLLVRDTTKRKSDGALINTGHYSYDIKYPYSNGIVQTNLIEKTITDYLKDFCTTSTYTYNQYGFPITENISTSDGYTTNMVQTVTHHTSSLYVLNIVNEQTFTTTHNDITLTTKTTFPEMYYNKPKKKYSFVNGNQISYETFTYNSLSGLISKHTNQQYSSNNTLTTTYQYDNFGHLVKETTPELYTKEYTYNAYGQLTTFKNELGNTESYTYDDFGRRIRTDFADGTWETIQYNWQEGSPTNYGELTDSYGYSIQHTHSNGNRETVFYDTKNREVERHSNTAHAHNMVAYNTYDRYGNLLTQNVPVKNTTNIKPQNSYTYDNLNRVTSISYPEGKVVSYTYNKNKVTVVEDGVSTTRTYDSQGNMTAVTDSTGTITYTYRPDGQMLSATVPCGLTTNIEYDTYGRRIKIVDPSAGATSFTYDAAGNMASQTNGAGKQTLMEYDTFGRLTRKEYVGTLSTAYSYNNKGLLTVEFDSNDAIRSYDYDQYGRLIYDYQTVDNLNTHNLTREYSYDSDGNLEYINYLQENGSDAMVYGKEIFVYNNGHLKSTFFEAAQLSGNSFRIWEDETFDIFGLPETALSGSLRHYYLRDWLQRPTFMATENNDDEVTVLREMEYWYNDNGNLAGRFDYHHNMNEYFLYDSMNRLRRAGDDIFEYDNATGNITYNNHVGYMYYGGGSKPNYRLTSIDPTVTGSTSSNYISTLQQTATYNAMSRPASITENKHTLEFTYNGRGERIKSRFYKKDNSNPVLGTVTTELEQRYYLDNVYERHIKENGDERIILYLGGDAYSAPAAFVMDEQYGPHMVYICRDPQGSITQLKSDMYTKEYSYDAWGNRRDPETHNFNFSTLDNEGFYLGRGYTGHEHHEHFGLINMNARLYEPITGRFISPDPFVQMPDNSQNFNRYTYCLNNPLRYTDPSGEIAWFIPVLIGAAVGAYTGASIQSGTVAFWDWDSEAWQGALAGAFIGASIGGMVSSAIGATGVATATGEGVSNIFGTATSIFNKASVNIGINSALGGGWDGAWKAGLSGAASAAWTATGGFNMVTAFGSEDPNALFRGKLGFQMIGTSLSSIGNNWSMGNEPFSRITLGVGPINFTLGKGEKLIQLEDNLANIITHGVGQINRLFGGEASWDWSNLSANYSGGFVDYFMGDKYSGYGAHAVFLNSFNIDCSTYPHELHHLWQSRSINNRYYFDYGLQCINALFKNKNPLYRFNYFEQQAYGKHWW